VLVVRVESIVVVWPELLDQILYFLLLHPLVVVVVEAVLELDLNGPAVVAVADVANTTTGGSGQQIKVLLALGTGGTWKYHRCGGGGGAGSVGGTGTVILSW
jgi:hypothetical protein